MEFALSARAGGALILDQCKWRSLIRHLGEPRSGDSGPDSRIGLRRSIGIFGGFIFMGRVENGQRKMKTLFMKPKNSAPTALGEENDHTRVV